MDTLLSVPSYCVTLMITLCSVINIHVSDGSYVDQRFTGLRGKGLRLRAEYVEYEFTSTGMIACGKECVLRSSCRTISWNSQTKTCLLSSTDVTNGRTASIVLETNTDWNTMSMMIYTVFGLDVPSGTSMTFAEAIDHCHELSTVVAGPDDLLYSHSLGFEYYRCCWLADGTIGYVMQYAENILYCNTNHSPWVVCKLN